MMVPDAWYPGSKNSQSQAMAQAYVAKYGGSASDINADVAGAYSVGEIVDQGVTHVGSVDNAKRQLRPGPANRRSRLGENPLPEAQLGWVRTGHDERSGTQPR
jgi:hypothetical protein